MMGYRKEIDGLRAIAVIVVILYHLDFSFFSGGYVGVDIFFVISGFLISNIILKKLEAGEFSFLDFFLKRALRLFPALFIMMISCLFVFSRVSLPSQFKDLAQVAVSQIFFASNILLNLKNGYFDAAAESKVLLHTWSLSIEEQFYLFLPAFMWLMFRFFRPYLRVGLNLVMVVSFFLMFTGLFSKSAVFYYLPTRMWEFGVGITLAMYSPQLDKWFRSRIFSEIASLLGLATILGCVTLFTKRTPYPSYFALLPTIGTALIILGSKSDGIVRRLLSIRPVVWIGLLSYSFYLWHWPAIVYFKTVSFEFNFEAIIQVLFATFVIGVVSYYLVEKPLRHGSFFYGKNRTVLAGYVLSNFLVVAVGYWIHKNNGFPSRLPSHISEATAFFKRKVVCDWSRYSGNFDNGEFCYPEGLPKESKPQFIVWGDSHASSIFPVLEKISIDLKQSFKFASHSGCPPVINVRRSDEPDNGNCEKFNDYIFNSVLKSGIKKVLLVARYDLYLVGRDKFDAGGPDQKIMPLLTSSNLNYQATTKEQALEIFRDNLTEMVDTLHKKGITVILLAPVPNFNINVADYTLKLYLNHKPLVYTRLLSEVEERRKTFYEVVSKLNVLVLDPINEFCTDKKCSPYFLGRPNYMDDDHLNLWGSDRLKNLLLKVF